MPPTSGVEFRLAEHERRLNELHQEIQRQRTRLHDLANICTSIPDHGRRLDELDDLQLAVLKADVRHLERRLDNIAENMATKSDIANLNKSVSGMTKWLAGVAATLLVSTVLFMITVATGQL